MENLLNRSASWAKRSFICVSLMAAWWAARAFQALLWVRSDMVTTQTWRKKSDEWPRLFCLLWLLVLYQLYGEDSRMLFFPRWRWRKPLVGNCTSFHLRNVSTILRLRTKLRALTEELVLSDKAKAKTQTKKEQLIADGSRPACLSSRILVTQTG